MGPQGEPVVAATAPEWSADVLLSAYPKYTLSFNLAFLFPASVQAFYNAALEPFFSVAVPRLEQVRPPRRCRSLPLGSLLATVPLLRVSSFSRSANWPQSRRRL